MRAGLRAVTVRYPGAAAAGAGPGRPGPPARRAGGRGRSQRSRQHHPWPGAARAHPARRVVRGRRRAAPDRSRPRLVAGPGGLGLPASRPGTGHGGREPGPGTARRRPGGDRGRGPPGWRRPVHRAPPGRLRHPDRGRRARPVGGAAPACRAGPRPATRRLAADPGRADRVVPMAAGRIQATSVPAGSDERPARRPRSSAHRSTAPARPPAGASAGPAGEAARPRHLAVRVVGGVGGAGRRRRGWRLTGTANSSAAWWPTSTSSRTSPCGCCSRWGWRWSPPQRSWAASWSSPRRQGSCSAPAWPSPHSWGHWWRRGSWHGTSGARQPCGPGSPPTWSTPSTPPTSCG